MAREPANRFDARFDLVRFAKNPDTFLAIGKAAAQRIGSGPTHDQNRVVGIADIISQMMQDAPRFGHTGSGDNDHRVFAFIQRFGFVHRMDVR